MIIRVQKNMTTEIISLNFLPITKGLIKKIITKHKIVYSFYIMWHLPTMSEYCEEEMWVWLFPHHKCQKILSNHESKTSDLTSFWHEWCGKKGYSHFRSHSICIVKNYNYADLTFFWKFHHIVVDCVGVHELYCHFAKCIQWLIVQQFLYW